MAKQKVQFKSKEGTAEKDKKAKIYGEHILRMMKEKSIKSVTAREVLEDAKDETTPYHDHFDWDDTSAAEQFRLSQARQLIASIVEVKIIREEEVPIRVFVNVIGSDGERAYFPMEYAMARPKLANQVIANALKEVKNWSIRYKEYQELARIREAIGSTEEEFIIGED